MAQYPLSSLEFIFNHVILPPELPHEAEEPQTLRNAELDLIRLVSSQAEEYYQYRIRNSEDSAKLHRVWKVIQTMLSQCLTLNSSQDLSQKSLLASLQKMQTPGVLLIRIKSQNAMIIVRKTEKHVVFECFEASPSAGAVTTCKGNLIRTFPARAVGVPNATFSDQLFQTELAATLSKADREIVAEMMPESRKAGETMPETRDTANPAIISDLMMNILVALGQTVPTQPIRKRTRDDVLWKKTMFPWRRSSLWLGVRVAIQSTLGDALIGSAGLIEYKNFMIFLLTEIAALALATKQPGPLCQVILAKIGRRTFKLGQNTTNFVQNAALTVCQSIRAELDKRWEIVQKVDADRATRVLVSSFSQDTALSLAESGQYLDAALATNEQKPQALQTFAPSCRVSLGWNRGIPTLTTGEVPAGELIFVLCEIEYWVEKSLPAWVAKFDDSLPISDDCMAITNLAKDYWIKARYLYADSPVELSRMLLVIAELWYAVDRMVTKLFPLLGEYSPVLDRNMFHPLLLPKRGQMQRLHIVEQHIEERYKQAKPRHPSVFSNPRPLSFAVRFFSSSENLGALRNRIEAQATVKKAEKQTEWQEMSRDHARLIAQAAALNCEYYQDDWGNNVHHYSCKKCKLTDSAKAMSIKKYEWPLPATEYLCKAAVFELDCPESFVAWRNLTWMLLHDIGRSEKTRGKDPTEIVSEYAGLRFFATDKNSRMTLGSIPKSMMRTHYTLGFPIELDKCYSANTLRYELLDHEGGKWVEAQTGPISLKAMCTLQLPDGPYQGLQYTVDSTDHAQNRVIADQESCSQGLSLHEFTSFGSLRADGERTQWLNIRRELAAANLNFNTEAVSTLVLQAVWEAGSNGETAVRISHFDLTDPVYCHDILTTINICVDALEANWKSDFALFLLISLTLRILSLARDRQTIDSALGLQMRMRVIARCWSVELGKLLDTATEESHIQKFQRRLLKAGMLCKLTYEVDEEYQSDVLSSGNDLSLWVVSSVLVRENTPGDTTLLPCFIRRMYLHDLKLTHALHERVLELVTVQKSDGLSQAVLQVWSGFRSATESWVSYSSPNRRWLSTETSPTPGRTSQKVFYNVLDGELLVDGKPVGRLPRDYLESSVYVRLFGAQIIKVLPADMPGMLYMSSQRHCDYAIYFGPRDGQVIIRVSLNLQILELVPHTVFEGDLPSSFVNDYVHWLDLSSADIEFRPVSKRWSFNLKNWRLHYRPQASSTIRQAGQEDVSLIDVRSKTCAAIMRIFGPLETSVHTHTTYSKNQILKVSFPRLDLSFILNKSGHFQCHELCKIVDPDQSLGTMIGLTSRLILCGLGEHAQKHDRVVLIPFGEPSVARSGHHVKVAIATTGQKVRVQRYQIDGILGRLQSDGDVITHLYKAYLHALTSSFLCDPLTGSTGTEEALSSLRLQSMSLSAPATQDVTLLLKGISSLTPARFYYPQHLRVMQQVEWHPQISTLAQHNDFLPLAQRILDTGNRYALFFPGTQGTSSLYFGRDRDLLERARFRNASHCSVDSGGNISEHVYDVSYEARDCSTSSERAGKANEIAALVRDWPQRTTVSRQLLFDIKALGTLAGFGTPFSVSLPLVKLLDVSFANSWTALHDLCIRSTQGRDKYKLMFAFSVMAYSRNITSTAMLRTLLAFAFVSDLRGIGSPPSCPSFTLTHGDKLNQSRVRTSIQNHMKAFTRSSLRLSYEEHREEQKAYKRKKKTQVDFALSHYTGQWPCSNPRALTSTSVGLLNVKAANDEISNIYTHWTNNAELGNYLGRAQVILDRIYEDPTTATTCIDWRVLGADSDVHDSSPLPTITTLMSASPPRMSQKPALLKTESLVRTSEPNSRLRALVKALGPANGQAVSSSIRRQYSDDLSASIDAFDNHKERITPSSLPYSLRTIDVNHRRARDHVNDILRQVLECVTDQDAISQIMGMAGLRPRLTLRTFLGLIACRSFSAVSEIWRPCLLALGEATTMLQRARRLLLACERSDLSNLLAELENIGRIGWESKTWPEWLLIEIENDLLIRPNQAQVAIEMLKPSSRCNSLTQLNMGEGKSSVIVPLVAAAIADGSQLSRVIVLKSLAKQMCDTLSVRLGGLVDRPLYQMPFTRKVVLTPSNISQIQILQEACKSERGILLAQPEHILSFKLIGIERLTAGKLSVAASLLKAQSWLDSNARDLLDESDEILDVKFQLIYTLGTQRMMDGQPDRWLITQAVFDLVEKHAVNLHATHPKQIEVGYRFKASFPSVRILSEEIGQTLMTRVAHDILKSYLPSLSFEQCSKSVTEAVLRFVQFSQVSRDDSDLLKRSFGNRESFLQKLLLVRGLVAYKIMLFVLRSKRFSVNYGLHPSRCLSAVPYRAKGVPAASAEFGHPDVAVALTCLTYYYTGLSSEQVHQCFEILQKSDDPSLEYGTWIARCTSLPGHLRDWNAVNLEDGYQFADELFPALRHGKKIADFFMANVVFPREGKEFDEKLSTSGWDIPSVPGQGHLTTGFSGTNDNRFLLPLSITQQDLPNLQHTSGKVLNYVLRSENLRYMCVKDEKGGQLSTKAMLCAIWTSEPNVRVLIDVGAQVLDVSNLDLVRMWLEVVQKADAGIFFDRDDTVMVLTRDRKLETLAASSFQARMDCCLVYLDEVHTRGTDLKLPVDARAAVTLGPRLSKDKLVQACMRLRKLAQGQSLLFVAPPEVHQSIVGVTGKADCELNGYDVVAWSLEQSCLSIERAQPLRVLQGLSHHQRQTTMASFKESSHEFDHLGGDANLSGPSISAFREKEKQRLTDLYAPEAMKSEANPSIIESYKHNHHPRVKELIAIWNDIDFSVSEGASMHEEHEREVAHEVEQEKQIQRPPRVEPFQRSVDPNLRQFVSAASLQDLKKFVPASKVACKTSAANDIFSKKPFRGCIYVTKDFATTVQNPQSGFNDNYLRPVNWILTAKDEEPNPSIVVIISQYEVNQLWDRIHAASSAVMLHVYEPRVTKSMLAVDSSAPNPSPSRIAWQCMKSVLRQALHLFAGQLYFDSYADYRELYDLLGRVSDQADIEEVLTFVKAWTAIRRKGQDFLPSHVGQIVSNRSIKEDAFE